MTSKVFAAKTFAAVVTAGILALAAVPQAARAASPVSEAFLANVGANTDFLARSSRLAAERADKPSIRDFARAEAPDEARFAVDVGLMRATLALASAVAVATAADGLMTGRSVAIDQPAASGVAAQVITTRQAANGGTAMGDDELTRLGTLSGRAFDDFYWQTQLDALSQIESDYRTYIASGDDPVLVATAKRELPGVMRRLEGLSKI